MARAISLIQQQILDSVAADPTLGPLLTSTSKRAIFNLWTFIFAVAINVLEQIIDIFSASVEATASTAGAGSLPWVQAQVNRFQYSATVPQVAQLINFVAVYPVVDPTLLIISRCSAATDLSNNVLIKVATGNPPGALTTDQLAALQSFMSVAGVGGITYICKSTPADQLFIQAEVFYQGQYGSSIQATAIAAINAYLAALPFNGVLKVLDMENAIRSVPGVTDVLLINVSARPDGTAFGSGTSLVLNNQIVSRLWNTVSGYMIGETTGGDTFADSLQFIPE